MASKLRYSEAVRLGAVLRPQAFGVLFDGSGTCANGAALEALGWTPRIAGREAWCTLEREPLLIDLLDGDAVDPIYGGRDYVCSIIVRLNNEERWSRERIADWVESIERERGMWPEQVPSTSETTTDTESMILTPQSTP